MADEIGKLHAQLKNFEYRRDYALANAADTYQRRETLKASFNLNWEVRPVSWRNSPAGEIFWQNFTMQYNTMTDEHQGLLRDMERYDAEISGIRVKIAELSR